MTTKELLKILETEEKFGHQNYKKKIDRDLCNKLKSHFVIHKHYAKKAGLHYDIRLERNCVLASWASRTFQNALTMQDGQIVKTAMYRTPDHELEYFNFEGTINSGYGKGYVAIWDTGRYKPIIWKQDRIIVEFFGEKIKGVYVLIKVGHSTWLFFKKKGWTS